MKPKIEITEATTLDFSHGGGAWPLYLDHVEDWAWQTQVFNDEELDAIIRIGEKNKMRKAMIRGGQNERVRNSMVTFLYPNGPSDWVFAKLSAAVAAANAKFFQFDLSGFDQGLQFTRYTAPTQHYDWHVDRGFNTGVRKLSISIQLSDPRTYKGGDLQLKFGKNNLTVARERGMVTFFPSYVLHRVTPVREGTRYSLVAWVAGPPFK